LNILKKCIDTSDSSEAISAPILSALAVAGQTMNQCAVCGADVERANPGETDYRDEEFAVAQVEYEGENYAFCSEEHRREFEERPDEYA
jgi:YHS domain-containing protein